MLSGGYATLPFGICTDRLSVVADPDGRKTNVGMDPAVPCEPTERKALKIIPGQLCCVIIIINAPAAAAVAIV